ncbi:elongation factor P [Candidatus Absconditicoccus praedator]|uniref:elongation factor P n=1 Tax=Candidatus Absconditicoccus praedator TaxID=2735562 RepID=UPI001E5B08C0|nr:elongation factor P [Candidatus Absconditicoccus praedator]UFX83064.1 elongation factor P [Candidatus Absconditicoccus praedator]
MKIETSDIKKGTVLKIDGKLYKVVDISHTHTGRGSATYGFKVKDIVNGTTNNFSYKSGTNLEKAEVNTKNAIFLYSDGENYSFMENDTSEIYDIPKEKIEETVPYLKDNLDVFLMIYEGDVIGIILPQTITYKIIETVPGVKGDRAQAGKKPAKVETGMEVMVPLHVEEGQEVMVNTTTGQVG